MEIINLRFRQRNPVVTNDLNVNVVIGAGYGIQRIQEEILRGSGVIPIRDQKLYRNTIINGCRTQSVINNWPISVGNVHSLVMVRYNKVRLFGDSLITSILGRKS